MFNEYFINVGRTLANKIVSTVNPMSYISSNMHSIFIPSISEDEVLHAISLLNNAAPGYDGLQARIMKQIVHVYVRPLTYLINMSLTQGIFPEELKLAKVIPIYKSEDEQLLQNYRPISVLPFFSKIYEKIMYKYVVNFLDINNILYHNQFGFRSSHSTNHAIITLVDKVAKALDTGKIVVGVFLDLKKAFDTVDHSILLEKLYTHGLRGNIYKWFKSYLSNRKQFVAYNGKESTKKYVTHGVPQGSVLGPLLFIIYMNDF